MKACVVRFAGSNCDMDTYHVLNNVMNISTDLVWHKDRITEDYDVIFLPGGFSYGDHLRPGAIARFSKVMEDVIAFAEKGGLVIGICNGFQVLCEAGLLPGVLMRNKKMRFICKDSFLKIEDKEISNSVAKNNIKLPIAHADGNYFATPEVLEKIEENNQVILRYSNEDGNIDRKYNPNGSSNNIAGICNEKRNVFGMMPHPERNAENILGNQDGLEFLKGIFRKYGRNF